MIRLRGRLMRGDDVDSWMGLLMGIILWLSGQVFGLMEDVSLHGL